MQRRQVQVLERVTEIVDVDWDIDGFRRRGRELFRRDRSCFAFLRRLLAFFGVAVVELAVQPAATAPASTAFAATALLAEPVGVGFERLTVLALFAFVTLVALILEGCVGFDLLGREILAIVFGLILRCLLPVVLALFVGPGFRTLVETAAAARPASSFSSRSRP